MDIKKFEKELNLYSFGEHQNFLTYFERLQKFDWSIEDLKEYIKDKKILIKTEEEKLKAGLDAWNEKMLKCPECSKSMGLFPVNTVAGDQTGDDSKSCWVCFNKECLNVIYNKKTAQEILNERR